MIHALKTHPGPFADIVSGDKTFEVRKNDRPFYVGDDIVLQEWDSINKTYTGQEWRGEITYFMMDKEYCKAGFCILGIKKKEDDKD